MIELTKKQLETYTYDDFLDYFRKIPTKELLESKKYLSEVLPVEGFAAASRWIEIIQNPSKMDKLYSARLKAKSEADIMQIAVGDDDKAFYEALIRENVQQLNTSNISQQEVARLTQNINIFRKELREIRSRKPKKGTVLEQVLKKAEIPVKQKKPAKKKASKTASKAKLSKETSVASSRKKNNVTSKSNAQN